MIFYSVQKKQRPFTREKVQSNGRSGNVHKAGIANHQEA